AGKVSSRSTLLNVFNVKPGLVEVALDLEAVFQVDLGFLLFAVDELGEGSGSVVESGSIFRFGFLALVVCSGERGSAERRAQHGGQDCVRKVDSFHVWSPWSRA